MRVRKLSRKLPALALMLLSACGLVRCAPDPMGQDAIKALYDRPLAPPEAPRDIYYIGHSLIARDMPAMVAQLADAPEGSYESQLGWGAELEAHWEPDVALSGAEIENDHPRFREAHEAVGSGEYDVLVLTEKVEIRASIKYHDSWHYLAEWAKKAWEANPETRVYFYETWPELDTDEGWLNRLDLDLGRYWEAEILDRALAVDGIDRPIYVIPAGQVMAALARELERRGGIGGIEKIEDIFEDTIHFNDLGA